MLCQSFHNSQQAEFLKSHEIPNILYHKVCVDFFHCQHTTYLLIVAYYSKFPEIVEMKTTTSKDAIEVLKQMFGRYGVPRFVVSDNGPQFSNQEFKLFTRNYGFETCFTNHAQSNDQMERYVQTVKRLLKKSILDRTDINVALLNYRNTTLEGLGGSRRSS